YIHLFLATDLTSTATDHDGPEEVHMTIERMALDQVTAAIDDGTISDAKTVIGLLAALRHLDR
ncbi:MAG: ADP-ribose pyrophosphatase, partial [Actinomycetia bacterium]|nr:ADP-ribose pyrophosphatase [Actinomycetes bacterium]